MAALPPGYTANAISLVSVSDGKLLHVSLYTGRAEISRQFKFDVQTGQNHLCITGLPNVIEQDSLRVQGHGNATIHDVSLSTTPSQPAIVTSPTLQELIAKKDLLRSAIHRTRTSSRALETYMSSMSAHVVPLTEVGSFLETYSFHGSRLDEELAKLKKEEDEVYNNIQAEKVRIKAEQSSQSNGGALGMQASIGLFAENEGQIELELVYAVFSANWEAIYDIRVNLESKDHPLTLIYKASIVQNTGEDWTNVPLTLETATPSYGVQMPTLNPLKLSTNKRPYRMPTAMMPSQPTIIAQAQPVIIAGSYSRSRSPERRGRSRSRSRSSSSDYRGRRALQMRSRRSRSPSPPRIIAPAPKVLNTLGLTVSSKGDGRFNHSVFQVPGLISVPCDGMVHNVTIVELREVLETKLLWFAVPKIDSRVHLNAKIKNTSEYALIPGKASVYVDGTFIARTDVPASGPDETFDCSLGLDSSIKITYHPLSTKITHRTPFTGFTGINSLSTFGTTKTTAALYSQRVTVVNTKRVTIDALKLVDRVPVSEDERIKVKILKPAELVQNRLGTGGEKTVPSAVRTSQAPVTTRPTPEARIVAQWDGGVDTNDVTDSGLGNDGKMNWLLYDIAPQGTVTLVLEWEVSAASNLEVVEWEA
ncbi:hypothetical protein F5050DRAFT_1685305 [Lentinula boryana]|uniref:Mucoidy inhibitor A n=1 Tax=Lentinula boryana TaxID=40481 RepID=A0ABQ8QP95_9AGAR|nr:hypothetical protein F5050DRAFT_1685305 [Lentinula boryana]